MNTSCRVSSSSFAAAICAVALLAVVSLCPLVSRAQSAATNVITGRVLNQGTGEYLRDAVVTAATGQTVVTEDGGFYTLSGVPAGEVKLTVTYTGLDNAEATVSVIAGQAARHDFNLTSKDYSAKEIVQLGQFVVNAEREGQAKAIQEQREAVNQKTVMASDAFGNVSEGNLGEFLKLMPGVTIDYNEADAKYVRIRGMDPKYTSVLMDGAPVATGSSSDITQNRAFDFEQLSVASVETIEMSKTPRAADSGNSVAGVVNVRSKGAFDSKGRRISYQFSSAINSFDMMKKTAGPTDGESYKIMPNMTLNYSDIFFDGKLGILAGFNFSQTFGEQKAETVNYAASDTDPTNNATELKRVSSFSYRDSPKPTTRRNFNTRLDYKFDLGNGGTLWTTAKVDYNTYNGKFYSRDLGFNFTTTDTTQPYTYNTQTTTATGATVNPNGGGGATDKHGTTQTLTTMAEYTKGAFRSNLIGQYSKATNYYGDLPEGFFWNMGATSPTMELRFNRGGPMDPGIFLTEVAGADWRNLANYTMSNPTTVKRATRTQEYTAKDDMSYAMPDLKFPVKLDFGLAVNESIRRYDKYENSLAYTFLGPTGVAKNVNPADYAEPYYRMNFNWGGNVDGMTNIDRFALARLLTTQPSWWTYPNFNTGELQYTLQNHDYFVEQINAAYVEPVIKFGPKFQIAPGVRYEFSHEFGTGPSDIGDTEARRILFGLPDSTPASKVPAWPAGTSDPAYILARYGSSRISGGNTYGNWLRYLHATYNITRDLAFRASFNQSITRADISNLIPGISGVNETATPYPTITVSNPDLKPEHGQSFNLELEYYFSRTGLVDLTFFRTDTKDLQRTVNTLLDQTGYLGDTTYANYMATTKENVAESHTAGFEFDYRQNLSGLGDRFRGFTVGANYTLLMPDDQSNYLNSSRHAANGTITYRYKNLNTTLKLNWTGVRKTAAAPLAGVSNAGWAAYQTDVFRTDVDVNYMLTRAATLFATCRNIFDEPNVTYWQSPGSPKIGTRWFHSGAIIQMGVKGTF